MAADLTTLRAKRDARLQIVHPAFGPLDAWITLAGPGNPATIRTERDALARQFQRPADQRVTADLIEADTLKVMVGRTLGWEELMEGDAPLEFTPAAAERIYSTPEYGWLRNFIDQALVNPKTFY